MKVWGQAAATVCVQHWVVGGCVLPCIPTACSAVLSSKGLMVPEESSSNWKKMHWNRELYQEKRNYNTALLTFLCHTHSHSHTDTHLQIAQIGQQGFCLCTAETGAPFRLPAELRTSQQDRRSSYEEGESKWTAGWHSDSTGGPGVGGITPLRQQTSVQMWCETACGCSVGIWDHGKHGTSVNLTKPDV